MIRRQFLLTALGLSATTPSMGRKMSRKNIREFEKACAYLKDPDLRQKEAGDALLTVDGAEFIGEGFEGMEWRNIVFKNCDFIGGYEIGPKRTTHVRYEDCRFSGILSYGVTNDVQFLRCVWVGASVMFAEKGSQNTVFDACRFIGKSPDPNQQGSVGSEGEVRYVGCQAKWFSWVGDATLSISDCECEGVSIHTDSHGNSGANFQSSTVLIERSNLRGKFNMATSHLQSLTIRDTVLENLNLYNATVKGDVVMERVKGGYINAYVKEAKSLSVRNSHIYGDGKKIFEAYAGGIRSIEIETVIFGGDVSTEPVTIAGGTGADLNNVRARVNDTIVIRNSKIPILSAHHVNTSRLQLQRCELDSLDLSSGRIVSLELSDNTIARSVDFTNTQAKESKLQPLAKGQAKLDGSNIKVE